jgi:hypothetical protein
LSRSALGMAACMFGQAQGAARPQRELQRRHPEVGEGRGGVRRCRPNEAPRSNERVICRVRFFRVRGRLSPCGRNTGTTDKQSESMPLTLRELTKWRLDAVRIMLAGNGAGFLGVGAGLVQAHRNGFSVTVIKIAGLCFFVGLLAFVFSLMTLYAVLMGHNQALYARNNRDFGLLLKSPDRPSLSWKA